MKRIAILIVIAVWGVSPLFTSVEATPPSHEHQIGSRVGVDCTPAGCISGSTMEYSYTNNSGQKVWWSRGCDKAPDGDLAGTQIVRRNGNTEAKKDPDGAFGECANLYVKGREPKGHRGVIWKNGRFGDNRIDVKGRLSCHHGCR